MSNVADGRRPAGYARSQGGGGRRAPDPGERRITDGIEIVSTNDHVLEPKDLFTSAAAACDRDRVPHVVESGDRETWMIGGNTRQIRNLGVAGLDPAEPSPTRYEDMRPGCYDPRARLNDLDTDGISVSVCFPSIIGYAGEKLLDLDDPGLAHLCARRYNDFIIEEWCAADSSRLVPVVVLPLSDPALAIAEIERTAEKGARGISFPLSPAQAGLPSWHSGAWDGVLSAATAANIPLCLHFATGHRYPVAKDAPALVGINACNLESMLGLIDLIHSPVPARHPAARFHLTEGSIGWLPYVLEKVDYYWASHGPYLGNKDFSSSAPPSSVFSKQFYGCFIEDYFGIRSLDAIGAHNVTWQADYPHRDGSFPNSIGWLEDQLRDLTPEYARLILEVNPRTLFGLPQSSADTHRD